MKDNSAPVSKRTCNELERVFKKPSYCCPCKAVRFEARRPPGSIDLIKHLLYYHSPYLGYHLDYGVLVTIGDVCCVVGSQ